MAAEATALIQPNGSCRMSTPVSTDTTVERLMSTAVLINLSTVVSVLTGVLILHEPFGWISAVASAAILVGIWGAQRFAAPTPTPAAGSEPLSPS